MGELIHLRELARNREIRSGRARDRESLARAIEIMKLNLHAVTREIIDAPSEEQFELLQRAEHLVEMIRYGLRMMGHPADDDLVDLAAK